MGCSANDADGDAIADEEEGRVASRDSDRDGRPDYLDPDSDGDTIGAARRQALPMPARHPGTAMGMDCRTTATSTATRMDFRTGKNGKAARIQPGTIPTATA